MAILAGGDVTIEEGGAVVVAARSVDVSNGYVGLAFGRSVTLRDSRIVLGTAQAAALGAALGAVVVLGRLLAREMSRVSGTWSGCAVNGSERGIFVNRTLNLRSIRAIGYDMDYTLIHYRVDEWERRAYEHARRLLAERGWPVADLDLRSRSR